MRAQYDDVYMNLVDIENIIPRFYRLCLGRERDSAGLDGGVAALLDGSLTRSDVA